MPVPLGTLNRRLQLRRRVAMPVTAGEIRGGFADVGAPIWAAWREQPPRSISIAGLALEGKSARVTVLESGFTRAIERDDLVVIDDETYEVVAVLKPGRPDGNLALELLSAPTRALYAYEFERRGEVVTLRRVLPSPQTPIEKPIRALVSGYQPQELIGGINQADRKVILSAEDVEASGFPLPLKEGSTDRLIIRGRSMLITSIDDSTHRAAGVLNAYEIRATG